jgi:hypothetical protein
LQSAAQHPEGVVGVLVSPLRVFVVDPRELDDLRSCVKAKEQPVLLKELRAEPVLLFVAERVP